MTTDLPNLTGSPKQIEWATRIRAQAIDIWLAGLRRKMATFAEKRPEQGGIAERVNAALDAEIASHTDASWWIDRRFGDGVDAFTAIRDAAIASVQGQK